MRSRSSLRNGLKYGPLQKLRGVIATNSPPGSSSHRDGEEACVEVARLHADIPEQDAIGRVALDLAVGWVQDRSIVESRPRSEKITSQFRYACGDEVRLVQCALEFDAPLLADS